MNLVIDEVGDVGLISVVVRDAAAKGFRDTSRVAGFDDAGHVGAERADVCSKE
jgi:hypothetical protein